MRTLDVAELTPLGELAPGVVLTAFSYGGREHRLVAKSGGFGGPELLRALAGAGTDDIREK